MRTGGVITEEPVTAANVDLSNCDRELIHLPGMIQPHGVMLVLRSTDLAILQASENTATLFGVPAPDLALKGLADLLGPEQAAHLCAEIVRAGDRLENGPLPLLLQVSSVHGHDVFDAIAHRAGGVVILELERVGDGQPLKSDLYGELAACIYRLQNSASLQSFLDLAVTQVRAFTGFDRVMAYQFADDGSGHVVAEARLDDLNGYLGQHFPASDIPAPARRLFALSWVRHLPDVGYLPVRLLPEAADPVDMSRSVLRHVSVMYSSYLKNMRVCSTMVLPLMKAGRLWGLMSCMHHAAPLHVPHRTRTAIEILSHMVSLLMGDQEDRDTAAYRQSMSDAIVSLGRQMNDEPVYHRGLSAGAVSLHGWLAAAGAALVMEDGITLFGATPGEPEVRGIAAWLDERNDIAPVFATDRLGEMYSPAKASHAVASGLLAARLMRSRLEFVMWFRPEIVQTIEWAGDPHKPVQIDVVDGEARLTPRASFEMWKETVHGRSEPWQECEARAAGMLRQVIAEAALVRMNDDLQRRNTELDSFAYVASHDLKEPLRGINNFATFLQRSADPKLTEEERGRIATIIRLTRRMDDLTDALLSYSRIGRADLMLKNVDLHQMVQDVLEALQSRLTETGTTVRVLDHLPAVTTDPVLLTEVFSNLIVNATKYNDRPAGERWVEIGCRFDDGRRAFFVRDNGIGIAGKDLNAIFQIFRRLHARDEYGGGNGAGLTIARRTVERLGGSLWAESAGPGRGATFLFTLGSTPPADALS